MKFIKGIAFVTILVTVGGFVVETCEDGYSLSVCGDRVMTRIVSWLEKGNGQIQNLIDSNHKANVISQLPSQQPGTRLVREWNGRTYTVMITEDGFAYNGMTYGSLTKIARIITGAHWSGPRFFGLNGKTGNGESTGGNGESDG
jgi:hypothetical protein